MRRNTVIEPNDRPETATAPERCGTAAAARSGDRVALRQLLVAADEDDVALRAWQAILDRVGSPYDVLIAGRDRLNTRTLVRADGVGRYNAVLLAAGSLLTRVRGDEYRSAFERSEWEELWAYECGFGVRQVALNTAGSMIGEDYGLITRAEGPVDTEPVRAELTPAGAEIFDYLRPDAQLPVSDTYLYRTSIARGMDAQPLLTAGSDVLGVRSVANDGRERIALTFSLGPDRPPVDLLGYGLLRWATKGVLLGEHRHWLNVDADDWFTAAVRPRPDGSVWAFTLTGADANEVAEQQQTLRDRYPLAGGFTLNVPYNGRGLDSPDSRPGSLITATAGLLDEFRWINHTLSHRRLNRTTYAESLAEIGENLRCAAAFGMPVPEQVLKTPEYSGLGVYHSEGGASVTAAPTDHGLFSSNKEMLRAAADLGVRYVLGNMSFPSHRPPVAGGGIVHPLQSDVLLVPAWPTSLAYHAATPDDVVETYNEMFGVAGTSEHATGVDRDYGEIIDAEAETALRHVMAGSPYTHTLHQANLHQYAWRRSIAFDWLDALLDKYSALYRVPLLNPDLVTTGEYVRDRNAHHDGLAVSGDAVWHRTSGELTFLAGRAMTLFVTGVQTAPGAGFERYGSDTVTRLRLAAGEPLMVKARGRSCQ